MTQDNLFLGFSSIKDLFNQMFKYKQIKFFQLLLITLVMVLLLALLPKLETYIWSPFWTLSVFVAVILLDFVTAIACSWQEKKFVTSKAIKVPFTLVSYLLLFSILHNFGNVVIAFKMNNFMPAPAFYWIAKGVYIHCFLINLLSSLKHMSKLGLINKQVSKYIELFIDIHKNSTQQLGNTQNNINNDNV